MKKMLGGMGLAVALVLSGTSGFANVHNTAHWTGASLPSSAQVVLVINKDQFQGNWKQFKGDVKKKWGKLTDDDLLVIEGDYDKFQGKVQERYGDRKAEVEKWTDEWFEKHRPVR